jgi:hypothetical protein
MNRPLASILFLLLPLAALTQALPVTSTIQKPLPRNSTDTVQTAYDTTTPAIKDTTPKETPYNPAAGYRNWSIKAKILPWFLGDALGISGFAGFEYGITKNQSIGIDGFVYYEESSLDSVPDTTGLVHSVGDYWHSIERAILLDYRYYFNFQRLRRHTGITPYILAYLRYGRIDRYYDPLYPLSDYWKDHEQHYSAGLQLGATFASWDIPIDVNIGLFEKEKVIYTQFLTHGVETSTNWRPVEMGFRLSVNLVCWWKIHKPAPQAP